MLVCFYSDRVYSHYSDLPIFKDFLMWNLLVWPAACLNGYMRWLVSGPHLTDTGLVTVSCKRSVYIDCHYKEIIHVCSWHTLINNHCVLTTTMDCLLLLIWRLRLTHWIESLLALPLLLEPSGQDCKTRTCLIYMTTDMLRCVQIEGYMPDFFKVDSGLWQCNPTAPDLCGVPADNVMEPTVHCGMPGRCHYWEIFADLYYADDVLFLGKWQSITLVAGGMSMMAKAFL